MESHGDAQMRWEDWAAYLLALAGIYLLVGVLFFYAGKSKVIDNHGMPAALAKQFDKTFISTFPGDDAAWWMLGILESVIFVLIVVSLVMREFMPSRRKPFLLTSLSLSIFTFSILAMGQNVTGQTSGVAELFLYAGATGVLFWLVLLMPPYRPGGWITSAGGR